MIVTGMLNQIITVIYSTSRDGFGSVTKNPVYYEMPCRWQEKFEMVLDSSGIEKVARAQAWLPTEFEGETVSIDTDYVFLFGGTEYTAMTFSNHYNMLGEREYIKVFLK